MTAIAATAALHAVDAFPPALREAWRAVYGGEALLPERRALVQAALRRFLERFGDRPVRVFRCPGRINLRGMHVDTHGGYLNLMTHQRETLAVAAPNATQRCVFVNAESEFAEHAFDPPPAGAWAALAAAPRAQALRGTWAAYVEGSVLRAQLGAAPLGIDAAIASDIPRGAALSSSHALCTAILEAALALGGGAMTARERILAVRDAEWYAGARTGTSDQGAMILGRAGQLAHGVLFPDDLDADAVTWQAWPEVLRVLVIDSHTARNLGGADRARYTRNRVAYTLALHVLRHTMREAGFAPDTIEATDRLARVTPARLGGDAALRRLLGRVPERCALDEALLRYGVPEDAAARACAMAEDAGIAPCDPLPLCGPLVFGVAESERARRFPEWLRAGDCAALGRSMRIGHAGDRVAGVLPPPFDAGVDAPIELEPGAYGASSPALDGIVDAAHAAGALGACLTGAGMAGAVLALCRAGDAHGVADALRAYLGGGAYAALAGIEEPLPPAACATAVVENRAPTGAGELPLGIMGTRYAIRPSATA